MRALHHLIHPQAAYQTLLAMWPDIKSHLIAGHRLEIEVRPERRNTEQNALLHALLGEIAATVEWAGRKRDIETWKRLVTAAWLRARGDSLEVLPALDGKGIDVVYAPTSKLTKAELSELVEFVSAWAIENGVECAAC